jgi:hypothetical protein
MPIIIIMTYPDRCDEKILDIGRNMDVIHDQPGNTLRIPTYRATLEKRGLATKNSNYL